MAEKKWILKSADGHIRGPYETTRVLRLLDDGVFTEEDYISSYPETRWIPISQEPEFFDHLISLLNSSSPEEEMSAVTAEDESEVSVEESVQESLKEDLKKEKTPPPIKDFKNLSKDEPSFKTLKTHRGSEEDEDVIELAKHEDVFRDAKLKLIFLPLAAVFFFLGFFIYFLTPEDANLEGRVHLIFPDFQKPATEKTLPELKKDLQKASYLFVQDRFSTYWASSQLLVRILESLSVKKDTLGTEEDKLNIIEMKNRTWTLLCLNYLELWPYTYQDRKDLRALSLAGQKTSEIRAGSISNSICRITENILRGKTSKSRSLLNSLFEQKERYPNYSLFLHYLKGIQLKHQKEFFKALGFLDFVQKSDPSWLAVYRQKGLIFEKLQKMEKAFLSYQELLKRQPKNKTALILSGWIEYSFFKHNKKAFYLLQEAISIPEPVPNSTLSVAYLALAELSLKRKENAEALEYIKKAYALNPSDIRAKNLLTEVGGRQSLDQTQVDSRELVFEGDQLIQQGETQGALAFYKTAYEQDNKNSIAALKAGKTLWKLRFGKEAITWLQKAIHADPYFVEPYVILAEYYGKKYEFALARNVLDKINHLEKNNHQVLLGFAKLEYERHNPQGSVLFAKKALEIYSGDVDTNILLAKSYVDLKQYNLAFSAIQRALELDKHNKEVHIAFAKIQAELYGLDTALEYLDELKDKYKAVDYYIASGELLHKNQRYSEAIEVFKNILNSNSDFKAIYLNLGRIYRDLDSRKEAERAFLKAATLDPSDAEVFFEAGLLFLNANEYQLYPKAEKKFNQVLSINKRYPLASYYLGVTLFKLKKYAEALAAAKDEMEKNPQTPEPHILSGEIALARRDYQSCIKEYQRAVQKSGQKNSNLYLNLAKCYRLYGNIDVALSLVRRAEKIESGNPLVFKEFGIVYEILGQVNAAAQYYEKYLQAVPNAPDSKFIQGKIDSLQR